MPPESPAMIDSPSDVNSQPAAPARNYPPRLNFAGGTDMPKSRQIAVKDKYDTQVTAIRNDINALHTLLTQADNNQGAHFTEEGASFFSQLKARFHTLAYKVNQLHLFNKSAPKLTVEDHVLESQPAPLDKNPKAAEDVNLDSEADESTTTAQPATDVSDAEAETHPQIDKPE